MTAVTGDRTGRAGSWPAEATTTSTTTRYSVEPSRPQADTSLPSDPAAVQRGGREQTTGASLVLVGGAAAALTGGLQPQASGTAVLLIGLSLVAAGWLSPGIRWTAGVGLPILGFGLGIELSSVTAPLAGYATTAAFVGVGAALMLTDRVNRRGWPAIAGLSLIDIGIAAATLPAGTMHPWDAVRWMPGLIESLAGFALLARAPRGGLYQRPVAAATPWAPWAGPRTPAVQAGAVFLGAVGVSLVDRVSGSLYEVVFALGLAYLLAGIVARHRRWTESGALLTALGAAITVTDFAPAAVAAIYALVFTAIVLAAAFVRIVLRGSVGGVGRSLIAVGLVLALLSALPSAGPVDAVRTHLDLLLPLGPAASALAVVLRWALPRRSVPGLAPFPP